MRILIVAHGHPELSAGGAEQAGYLLFRALKAMEGIQPFFLAWTERVGATGISSYNGRTDEFLLSSDGFDDFMLSQPSPAIAAAFWALVEALDLAVVHFHHYLNIGLELIAGTRRARPNIRVIVTLHEYRAICHHHGLMVKTADLALCDAATDANCACCFGDHGADDFARRRQFIQSGFQHADLFIAPSLFLKERYVAWGIPASRIAIQDNGVAPADVARRSHPPGGRHGAFGFFGQIHPFKGLHCLFAAFDRLCRASPPPDADVRLIVNGAHLELNHPDYIAGFNRALAENTRIDFAGPYRHESLPTLMEAVDWVVVPSIWWENSPLVIQEAFAHRRPVICADIGGMAEKVRHGLDGFHFRAGDAAALAALMAEVAADGRIWDRLQRTLRAPTLIDEAAAGHLTLYGAA